MPGTGRAEIYFIASMMILTVILSITAIYIFLRTYKKEMREKALRNQEKARTQSSESEISNLKSEI